MQNASDRYWLFITIPLVLILLLVSWWGADYWQKLDGNIAQTAQVDADCDLHAQPCEGYFYGDGRIRFSITPRPVQPLVNNQLEVIVENIEVSRVRVDFQGIEVYMGYYRPELQLQESTSGTARYTGDAVLSVCTLDRMTWKATVILDTPRGTYIAPFAFEVDQ